MPPAKRLANDDNRSDTPTVRERQIAAAAHARNSKKTHPSASAMQGNGGSLKDLALASVDAAATSQQAPGMSWQTLDNKLLDTYRIAHNLQAPAAFTSPLHQALLTNPGIGRQSPTMARAKHKRRIPKEQLAMAVRKNFNSQGVSETDVVVNFVYGVKNQEKSFKMRMHPGVQKKQQ